ncbi:MAG: hypothetical protein ACYCPT_11915 [Acidimicrobiales bacterium]
MPKSKTNTYCLIAECKKIAAFNKPGLSPIRCSNHAEPDMINVLYKHCCIPNCVRTATHNICGAKKLYCGKHSTPNMAYLHYKFCEQTDCYKTATFAFPNISYPTHCKIHADIKMVNVSLIKRGIIKTKETCVAIDCSERAVYCNKHEYYPQHCGMHKQTYEMPLIIWPCIKCKKNSLIPIKAQYCANCFTNNN